MEELEALLWFVTFGMVEPFGNREKEKGNNGKGKGKDRRV